MEGHWSARMDYGYLNQTGFEANCSLGGMDGGLANCNIASSYSELGPCGQVSQAYRYNPSVRSFASTPSISPASCSMMPRPRDHPQPPMFPSGEYTLHTLPSKRSAAERTVLPQLGPSYIASRQSTQIRFAPGKIVLPSLTLLMATTKHRLFVGPNWITNCRDNKFCIICSVPSIALNSLFVYISKIDKEREKIWLEFNKGFG